MLLTPSSTSWLQSFALKLIIKNDCAGALKQDGDRFSHKGAGTQSRLTPVFWFLGNVGKGETFGKKGKFDYSSKGSEFSAWGCNGVAAQETSWAGMAGSCEGFAGMVAIDGDPT